MTRGRYERKRLAQSLEARIQHFLSHCQAGPRHLHEEVSGSSEWWTSSAPRFAAPRISVHKRPDSTTLVFNYSSICRFCQRSIELVGNQWQLTSLVIEEDPVPDAMFRS